MNEFQINFLKRITTLIYLFIVFVIFSLPFFVLPLLGSVIYVFIVSIILYTINIYPEFVRKHYFVDFTRLENEKYEEDCYNNAVYIRGKDARTTTREDYLHEKWHVDGRLSEIFGIE